MPSTNQSKKRYIIIAVIILAAVAGIFYYLQSSGKVNVKSRYAGNIAMIYNSYVYKVWFSDSSIGEIKFIKTAEGNFVPFDEEKMDPNQLLSVGLVVHENGTSITSNRAVYPWLDENDQEGLRKTAQEICDYQKSLGNDVYFELSGGESITLNMYSRVSKGREKVEMTECVAIESADAEEQNIGLLKPKAYAIPYEYAAIDLQGVQEEDLKEGNKLSMLVVNDDAFSTGDEVVTLVKGKITSNVVSSNVWYDFENKMIAEGAPVFDKKGRLVAINSVIGDEKEIVLMGRKINFKETVDEITKKELQKLVNNVLEMNETMNEVDKAQKMIDSIMKGIDTIGQGLFIPMPDFNIEN